jgi:hypothetical protein
MTVLFGIGSVVSDYSFGDPTKNAPGEMTEIRSKDICNDALESELSTRAKRVFETQL